MSSFHIPGNLLIPIAMVLAALALIVVAAQLLRSNLRKRTYTTEQASYKIRLADYASGKTPHPTKVLRLQKIPVHLPVVVVAPIGRGGKLPHPDLLPRVLDRVVPGMSAIMEHHQTATLHWPAQLSTSGFRERFFGEIKLPGERGKGTEWSAVAGAISAAGYRFSIGLVLHADQPNNYGLFPVDQEGQWLGLFQVDA
jgi:hypothetical protein